MSDYYNYFDQVANGGRVFDTDLSVLDKLPTKHLSQIEIVERQRWRSIIPNVKNHYKQIDRPQVTTTELLLQQRVMVPNLESSSVSTRSQMKESRRGRRYPTTINAWNGFRQLVEAFRPPYTVLDPEEFDIFKFSMTLTNVDSLPDEAAEETYMLQALKSSLVNAGILGKIKKRGGLGKPDAFTLRTSEEVDLATPSDIGLIVEFKSTHNLPLPMSAATIATSYNKAFRTVIIEQGGRSSTLSRVCHPIGQILGYMAENGRRYGVLSCATRSYFLKIEGQGADARVFISDPFFVGQNNFLRAWAFAHSLAHQQVDSVVAKDLGWSITSSRTPTPPEKSTYSVKLRQPPTEETNEEHKIEEGSNVSSTKMNFGDVVGIDQVPIDDVRIVGTLGYGRNGVVYLAEWSGTKVALKQFDVGKDGYDFFDKEISAYLTLKDAWGKLVPTPLFVAESWSGLITFIGLQLGRDPRPGDDLSTWSTVLSTLESQYGFRHDDAEDGNMIFVMDEATGSERLVAIDLEAHTMAPGIAQS